MLDPSLESDPESELDPELSSTDSPVLLLSEALESVDEFEDELLPDELALEVFFVSSLLLELTSVTLIIFNLFYFFWELLSETLNDLSVLVPFEVWDLLLSLELLEDLELDLLVTFF